MQLLLSATCHGAIIYSPGYKPIVYIFNLHENHTIWTIAPSNKIVRRTLQFADVFKVTH